MSIDYKKIQRLAKQRKNGKPVYSHVKVSSPNFNPIEDKMLLAPVTQSGVSAGYWEGVKRVAARQVLKGHSKQAFQQGFSLAELFEPSVVESHVAHAEVLQDIDILNDPKKVVKVDPDKYLYTHASIISSVNVEQDEHTIATASKKDINKNGDAWETQLLLSTYKSFIGAYNYLEHVQVPAMKKGWIIDSVARYAKNDDGKKFAIIDILVATEREHKTLISALESGELNTMSMGCSAKFTICSKCGYVSSSDVDSCDHIPNKKLTSYKHDDGSERYVAELCGHYSDKESVVFEEASWVYDPAFVIAEAKRRVASVQGEAKKATPEALAELYAYKKELLKKS
jgi:hypothetical protein